MCETSGQNNKEPELAEDGLCVNTGCKYRGTTQCPVVQLLAEQGSKKARAILDSELVPDLS